MQRVLNGCSFYSVHHPIELVQLILGYWDTRRADQRVTEGIKTCWLRWIIINLIIKDGKRFVLTIILHCTCLFGENSLIQCEVEVLSKTLIQTLLCRDYICEKACNFDVVQCLLVCSVYDGKVWFLYDVCCLKNSCCVSSSIPRFRSSRIVRNFEILPSHCLRNCCRRVTIT